MISQYFSYEKNKVIQALRYHFISRKEIKIMIIVVNVFAIVSAALFFSRMISPLAFLISSVLWFTLMIAFWFLLPKMVYKKSKTFQDRFRAVLETETFAIENERGIKHWGWNEFSDSMESPHFFHLYFDSRSFLIIPKSAFLDNDLSEARKIISAKINRR